MTLLAAFTFHLQHQCIVIHAIVFRSPRLVMTTAALLLLTTANLLSWSAATTSSIPIHPREKNLDPFSANEINTQRRTRQEIVTKYKYLTSEQIQNRLFEYVGRHPELATLKSSQELYDLPAAGTQSDCPFDNSSDGCKNWILTIEDGVANPPNSESARNLPEVFLSGALHGNERIGPTSVVETAGLLLAAASCEAIPLVGRRSKQERPYENVGEQEATDPARSCRADLARRGISEDNRKWLARLVTTRRIVIVPTANALGYYQNVREEAGIDPNRDFPYDLQDYGQCMRTIAGRTINEVFREHMFQIAVTFHAGMEMIGYEWGAPSYKKFDSPDDESQKEIAQAYSKFGGKFSKTGGKPYPYGSMNSKVYPVRGGMEDWAYAASWDTELTRPCTPNDYGGYPKEKTTYNQSTLRMPNTLVETSDSKEPNKNTLGTDEDLFTPMGGGNGHISRNIRLSLLMIDVVEPYANIHAVDGVPIVNDIVPLDERSPHSCQRTKLIVVPAGGGPDQIIPVHWSIGGGVTVEETFLIYGKLEDMSTFDGIKQPTQKEYQMMLDFFKEIPDGDGLLHFTQAQPGITRWHPQSAEFDSTESMYSTLPGQDFSAEIDASLLKEGESWAVIAVTRMDNSWAEQPKDSSGSLPPQTHIANVRTNPDWHHESANKVIQGRLLWFSIPVSLEVGPPKSAAVEISTALSADMANHNPYKDSPSSDSQETTYMGVKIMLFAFATGSVLFILHKSWKMSSPRFNKVKNDFGPMENDLELT